MEVMNWRQMWAVALGHDPPIQHLSSPFMSAIIVFILVLLFSYLLYRLTELLLPKALQEYGLDFFKTLAFCGYCFGHGITRSNYGSFGYIVCMVPVNTASVFLFKSGFGSPLAVWASFLKKQLPAWQFIVKVTIQIAAGFAAWQLGLLIFQLDFHPSFVRSLQRFKECHSDLRVPFYIGALVEMTGVTWDAWMNMQTLSRFKPLDVFLKFLNTSIVVCLGVSRTWMYLHPAMATGRTFGCGSTPIPYHLLVYWVGPFIGVFLATKINELYNLPSLTKPKVTDSSETSADTKRKPKSNGRYAPASNSNKGNVRQRNNKKNTNNKKKNGHATRH